MTNKEFFPNTRTESAQPNAVEAPAQMADERAEAELSADEQESLAGGIRFVGYNHNQNLAVAAPSGRYGILATVATGPIVITVERGRLEVFSSPYLAATEPTDDYAVGLPDEIGFHARSNQ